VVANQTLPRFDFVKLISWLAGLLVAILALLAFILSYSSLQHMAATNGVPGWLSYLWPLLLDFAMVVFSLAILRANLRQEGTAYPWLLTVVFASLATLGNVMDVSHLGLPSVAVAACVKALAPIALVLAFELLMSMVRAEIKRSAVIASIADLDRTRTEIHVEIDKLAATRERVAQQVRGLKRDKKQHYAGIGEATRERAAAILAEQPSISGAELGRLLGKSDSTGRKLRRELLGANPTPNGHGQGVSE
jgi:hypothetical protein